MLVRIPMARVKDCDIVAKFVMAKDQSKRKKKKKKKENMK